MRELKAAKKLENTTEIISQSCYEFADAMLTEREKRNERKD